MKNMTFKPGRLYQPRTNPGYLIFVVQVDSDPSRYGVDVEVTVLSCTGLIERRIVLTPKYWVELESEK
jgi:hypothetical protein